ncbi:MAG: hypothetical protein A3K61_02810 [Thaumarchaeota archaeon RBG_16_49_8]|nr:MAG: hypothetical protein A3K61_02810 [Thaumarchaeota archaeon RBG_16_49_8]
MFIKTSAHQVLACLSMDALQFLVTIGLLSNLTVLAVAIKKLSILENLFLLNWVEVTVSISLISLGFFTWFLAESMEDIFNAVYSASLPLTFILLIAGQLMLIRVLWRRPK